MELLSIMKQRHSVRQYLDKEIDEKIIQILQKEIDLCNKESGLHIQLMTQEKNAFNSMMAHYGQFKGVNNYFALVGTKSHDLEEKVGYYGERLVLKAQELGLNTCWVVMTFSKRKSQHVVKQGEKFVCVIALGYGETQGIPHKNKSLNQLCEVNGEMPDWFHLGMEAAILAPTAMNQQKFKFFLKDDKVDVKTTGGFYSKIDLGIVKYHFEIMVGKERCLWEANK